MGLSSNIWNGYVNDRAAVSNHEVSSHNLRQNPLRTHLAFSMLPEQDSTTNPTASRTPCTDPSFSSFLPHEPSPATKYQAEDHIKTEQDNITNSGYPYMEQQMRRETQQQGTINRPGHYQLSQHNLRDENEDFLESALAVRMASVTSLQTAQELGVKRPCTPPHQMNFCKSPSQEHNRIQWANGRQGNFRLPP